MANREGLSRVWRLAFGMISTGLQGPGSRVLAKATRDAAHRLLAPAGIYEGGPRTEGAPISGFGLQTMRDRVLRFKARGPDDLIDAKAPEYASKLDDSQGRALLWPRGRQASTGGNWPDRVARPVPAPEWPFRRAYRSRWADFTWIPPQLFNGPAG